MSLPENARTYAAIGTATLGLATVSRQLSDHDRASVHVCGLKRSFTIIGLQGLAASYNAIVIPMIINSKVKTPEKLKLWRQGYNLGVSWTTR